MKIVRLLFATYKRLLALFQPRGQGGISKGAIIIFCALLFSALANQIHPVAGKVCAILFAILLFSAILFVYPTTSSDIVKKITRNDCATPLDLFRKFTHIAFVCGLGGFAFMIALFLVVILYLFSQLFAGGELKIDVMMCIRLIIASDFLFTFLYFCYHIDKASQKNNYSEIEKRVNLYTAITSSITFIFLWMGQEELFELFLSGLALVFLWIQYILSSEKDKTAK